MTILPDDAGSKHALDVIKAAVLEDSSLSYAARGLFLTLASRPGVQWNLGDLIESSTSSPWEVSGAIAELANRSLIESGGYGWRVTPGPEVDPV